MAGLRQQPQGAQAPRDPVAQDETLQTLPSLVSLRNLRNPAPGLATALVNFARLVQILENQFTAFFQKTKTRPALVNDHIAGLQLHLR